MSTLFESFQLGDINLKNKVVMAPMTRSRAIDNIPNDLMVKYYEQRSGAGLIITEGTAPSPNGCGYPRIPGIWNDAQIEGWKKVTDAVHANGGKIFLQIMHTGRIGHPENLPEGGEVVSSSAVQAGGEMYTDSKGPQPHPTPRAMTIEDIKQAQEEHVQAAKNAIAAGFDGVELHGANGYLLEQFFSPHVNKREDEYGGSHENRARFVLETAQQVVDAIGAERTAIRLSPYGANADMQPFEGTEEAYAYIAKELGKLNLAYVHVADHSPMGAPDVSDSVKENIRTGFGGTYILSGGYDKDRAEKDLEAGKGHLVAFGRPFISNPDLVTRMKEGAELADPDFNTFYTPGEKGYTDYPTVAEKV